MHSCELRVKDEWMRQFQISLKNLVRQFNREPQMETAGRQIEEVSVFHLSVSVHSGEEYLHPWMLFFSRCCPLIYQSGSLGWTSWILWIWKD